MPILYWSLAFSTAVYLINRMPTPILKNISPFTKLFSTQPNYTKLKSFGCLCFPWLRPCTSHKLDPKSIACVFVGYSSSQSAYYCLDPKMNKIFVSRHVKFIENIFPFSTQAHTSSLPPADIWCPKDHDSPISASILYYSYSDFCVIFLFPYLFFSYLF